jgi:protein gp37
MSDLFGEWVTDEMLYRIFAVMEQCPHHTFQILTKRARRMCDWFHEQDALVWSPKPPPSWIWAGVSVEDQRRADERGPLLRDTPAAVRFFSVEPQLEHVDLRLMDDDIVAILSQHSGRLDWVIIGGESGPQARPFNIEWARSVVAQCRAAGVACFVKQLGAKPFRCEELQAAPFDENCAKPQIAISLRDRKGGDISEFPEDLRVREYPDG